MFAGRSSLPDLGLTLSQLSIVSLWNLQCLTSINEFDLHGCSRTPRCRFRNGERDAQVRSAAKSRSDAGLGDPARWPAGSPHCKPKRRRDFATVEKAPRLGFETSTQQLTNGESGVRRPELSRWRWLTRWGYLFGYGKESFNRSGLMGLNPLRTETDSGFLRWLESGPLAGLNENPMGDHQQRPAYPFDSG